MTKPLSLLLRGVTVIRVAAAETPSDAVKVFRSPENEPTPSRTKSGGMPLRPVPQGPAAEVTQPPAEVQRGNPTVFQRWGLRLLIEGGTWFIFSCLHSFCG